MEKIGVITEKLLQLATDPEQVRLIRQLSNAYGAAAEQLKSEILEEVNREADTTGEDVIPVNRITEIVTRAGENL